MSSVEYDWFGLLHISHGRCCNSNAFYKGSLGVHSSLYCLLLFLNSILDRIFSRAVCVRLFCHRKTIWLSLYVALFPNEMTMNILQVHSLHIIYTASVAMLDVCVDYHISDVVLPLLVWIGRKTVIHFDFILIFIFTIPCIIYLLTFHFLFIAPLYLLLICPIIFFPNSIDPCSFLIILNASIFFQLSLFIFTLIFLFSFFLKDSWSLKESWSFCFVPFFLKNIVLFAL